MRQSISAQKNKKEKSNKTPPPPRPDAQELAALRDLLAEARGYVTVAAQQAAARAQAADSGSGDADDYPAWPADQLEAIRRTQRQVRARLAKTVPGIRGVSRIVAVARRTRNAIAAIRHAARVAAELPAAWQAIPAREREALERDLLPLHVDLVGASHLEPRASAAELVASVRGWALLAADRVIAQWRRGYAPQCASGAWGWSGCWVDRETTPDYLTAPPPQAVLDAYTLLRRRPPANRGEALRLAAKHDEQREQARRKAREEDADRAAVRELLASGPMSARDVKRAKRWPTNRAKAAIDALVAAGEVRKRKTERSGPGAPKREYQLISSAKVQNKQ